MRTLFKFIASPLGRKWEVCEVAACVVLWRVLLSWLPFRWIFGWSQRRENATRRYAGPGLGTAQEKDLAALVRRVSLRVPQASCLTQALALQSLLARRRRHSRLQIGVGREQGGVFRAHAWLETDYGIVIGGGEDLGMYRPLSRGIPSPPS